MTTFTETISTTFHVVSCATCGTNFGINDDLYRRVVQGHNGSVHCPSCGKESVWGGKTEDQKKIDKLEADYRYMRNRRDILENDLISTNRSLRATKGVVTRLKKRVGAGVCPCCNRHFTALQRHIENKHPELVSST